MAGIRRSRRWLLHRVRLRGLEGAERRGTSLLRVEYDETEQKRLIRNLIDGWRSIFDGEAPLAGGWLAMAAALFAQSLGLLAVSFKNTAFSEENEWRLVYVRPRFPQPLPEEHFNVDVRARDGVPVPFVRFVPVGTPEQSPRLPIESVIIGPNRYQDLATSGVWHLLGRHGLADHVEIGQAVARIRV